MSETRQIDRAALVDAAMAELDTREHGYQVRRGLVRERDVAVVLDAVLPLIAGELDAHAAAWKAAWERTGRDWEDGQASAFDWAAIEVRSYLGESR